MTTPSSKKDLRVQFRRTADQINDDLYKSFSTPHCHSCIERTGDAVLLLDNEIKVLYVTSQMLSIICRPNKLFTLTPRFALTSSHNNFRIESFFKDKNEKINPLVLQLAGEKDQAMILLSCFRLPELSTLDLHTTSFIIKLLDPSQMHTQKWNLFTEQYALTSAEIRLCHALTNGLTLYDCSINWGITIHTIRSQLKNIFSKTSTRRQVDLLRLINLYFLA